MFGRCVGAGCGRQDLALQSRANFSICLQLSDLVLRLAGALFTKGNAVNGKLGFRLTKRANCHGYLLTDEIYLYFTNR